MNVFSDEWRTARGKGSSRSDHLHDHWRRVRGTGRGACSRMAGELSVRLDGFCPPHGVAACFKIDHQNDSSAHTLIFQRVRSSTPCPHRAHPRALCMSNARRTHHVREHRVPREWQWESLSQLTAHAGEQTSPPRAHYIDGPDSFMTSPRTTRPASPQAQREVCHLPCTRPLLPSQCHSVVGMGMA